MYVSSAVSSDMHICATGIIYVASMRIVREEDLASRGAESRLDEIDRT